MSDDGKRRAGTVAGAAGLACVACCAGPIVAALTAAGIGLATVAGVAAFGAAGLVVLLLAVPALGRWYQRRRPAPAAPPPGPVPVAAPTARRRAAEGSP